MSLVADAPGRRSSCLTDLEIASPGKKGRVRNDIATQGVLKKANVTGSRRAWGAKQLPDRPGDCFTRKKGPGSQ
jgi:hypothetical protein